MELWRRLFAIGRSTVDDRIRRVVVIVLEGLELDLVERSLEQGLLHNLALLSDIGTRVAFTKPQLNVVESLARVANTNSLRSVFLPAVSIAGAIDLRSICAADRAQQARLFAALSRRPPQIVGAEFDMPLQMARLFGPDPRADEQIILRDIYARMDEVVGKAFSFLDEQTALLTLIPGRHDSAVADGGFATGFLYASRPLPLPKEAETSVSQLVLPLLDAGCRVQ